MVSGENEPYRIPRLRSCQGRLGGLEGAGAFEYILCLAPGILYLAFDLFCCTFDLFLGFASPFACLTFNATRDVLNFAFHSILVQSVEFTFDRDPRAKRGQRCRCFRTIMLPSVL